MAWLKRARKKQCLGLELRGNLLRAVLLKGQKAQVFETEGDDLTAALERFVQENNFQKTNCAYALPDRLVFTGTLKVSSDLKGQLLEQQLLFEVHQQLPGALEHMSYDYQILSEENGQKTVFLAAAKTEDVDKHKQLLEAAILLPVRVETVQFALIRAVLSLHADEKHFALLSCDNNSVSLSLVDDELVSYHNEQKFELGSQTDVIVDRLLSWLESSGHDLTNRTLFLVGEGASQQLAQDLQLKHQVKVQCLNITDLDNEHPAKWALAYGLALGGLVL